MTARAPRSLASWLRRLSAAAGWVLCLAVAPAWADVWAYVDDKGVAHFAAEQQDARYQLYFRGAGSPAPTEVAADTARAVSVPTTASRLLIYFDILPSYKSVKYLLREAATRNGIEYELLKALIATESGFDAGAVSPKGAVGLMQLMPATAQSYGVAADARHSVAQKLADPQTNIRTGARHLGRLMKLFPGQLDLVLAAYNAGEGAVQRAGNRVPDYRETQNYVSTVLQIYALLKPPATVARQAASARVHVSLPGGVTGRGNMISSPSAALTALAAPVADPALLPEPLSR